jgi:hypothetical protein
MMNRRHGWLGLALAFGVMALPASAQLKLEWKLMEGDHFYLEEKVVLRQNVKLMNTPHLHEMAFTRVTRFGVLKKNQDGGYLLKQKIEAIKLDQRGAANKKGKMLRAQEGAVFKVTLTPQFKVAGLDGYEALVKKLSTDEDIAPMVRVLMPRQGFAGAVEALFGFLPDRAVDKGAAWTWIQVRPLGALGSIKIENTCTSRGPEKLGNREVVKLAVTPTKSLFSPPQGESAFAFKVRKGDIRVERDKSSATISFDAKLGRLVSSETTLAMTGTLTVSVMGTTIAMEVEHEEKVVSRVLDKNPLP